MDKLLSFVSVEKFAAYLDGNLSDTEMQKMDMFVASNSEFQELVMLSDMIDEEVHVSAGTDLFDADMFSIGESDFEIPVLGQSDEGLDLCDFFDENIKKTDFEVIDEEDITTLCNQTESDNNLNTLAMKERVSAENQAGAMIARSVYGESGLGTQDAMIYQGNEGICAIRSQQIILRDYGIDISIDELKEFAIQNGWYDPSDNGGTPMWAIGQILESCNVDCRQQMNCTVYDLVSELAQGHRVIVGVDANELWAVRNGDSVEQANEWYKDFFEGETPNHALIVAGVEVNPDNPQDVKVILTDPGTGDLRIEYDLEDFMEAWKDSDCFMTTTTTPAPLQYDPSSGCEVPSNFAVEEFINTNILPLNPDNVILPDQMAAMCMDPYYDEGHLDVIPVNGDDVDFEIYAAAVEKAHDYQSTIGADFDGLEHSQSYMFIQSLQSMLGADCEPVFIETGISHSGMSRYPIGTDDMPKEGSYYGDDGGDDGGDDDGGDDDGDGYGD